MIAKVIPREIVYNCGIGCKYYRKNRTDGFMFCIKNNAPYSKLLFRNGFPIECELQDIEIKL